MRLLAVVATLAIAVPASAGTLFREGFEDTSLAARGWYDNTSLILTTAEHIPGSTRSVEYRFLPGARTPASGGGIRHLFNDSDGVYISYYVKYSASWTGSNQPYHPHEFHLVSNVDSRWIGPAYTHLTTYLEQNEGEPLLAIQDGDNVDELNIGVDLTQTTGFRSVAGCNGDSDGHGPGDCYLNGGAHWNGKAWRAGRKYFDDVPGPYYKNDWHFVEAYFGLNRIVAGRGARDGVLRYWFDGVPVIDVADAVLRTAEWTAMSFNQFLIAPYIGDGSPLDQTMWVDDLTLATERVADLARNDQIRTLTSLTPSRASIFASGGLSSLDLLGPDRIAGPGEGSRQSTNGSDDDDDLYLVDFTPGAADPDPRPVVADGLRPLVFYQVNVALNTLRLTKTPGASVALTW